MLARLSVRATLRCAPICAYNYPKRMMLPAAFSTLARPLMNLNLNPWFVTPHMATISQLPEVAAALKDQDDDTFNNAERITNLERAVEIFELSGRGGKEHKAALALLAQAQPPESAIATLLTLQEFAADDQEHMNISFALGKTYWYAGDVKKGFELCDSLLEYAIGHPSLLYVCAAKTGFGINRLMTCDNADVAFTALDPLRFCKLRTERCSSQLQNAVVLYNFGTAEAIHITALRIINRNNAIYDRAMQSWMESLRIVKRLRTKELIWIVLESQLYTNLAWGMMRMEQDPNYMQRAEKYALKGLKAYDSQDRFKEGLNRTLTVLAIIQHKNGSAVTAEGLLRTATSGKDVSTMNVIEKVQLKASLLAYANLLRDWENREGDAEQYEKRASEVNALLPKIWQQQQDIFTGLWYWTPGAFAKESMT